MLQLNPLTVPLHLPLPLPLSPPLPLPLSPPLSLTQTSLRNMFKAKGLRSIVEVDGVEPTNTPLRNELFAVSGKRGVYPQVFIKSTAGAYEFVGE